MPRSALLAGILLVATGLGGQAGAFEDAVTGLVVEPPAPLTAEKIANPNFAAAIGVRAPPGSPQPAPPNEFLCQVGFAVRPVDDSQDEINAATLEPSALADISAQLAGAFENHENATFIANGVAGIEIFATPRDATGNRLYTTLLQTPVGLVQQHCTTTAAEAEAALVLFRAIRDSIVSP